MVHAFPEDIDDFDRRFVRYGRGMRTLAEKRGFDLTPFFFRALSPELQDLADRQAIMMGKGYGAAPRLAGPRSERIAQSAHVAGR